MIPLTRYPRTLKIAGIIIVIIVLLAILPGLVLGTFRPGPQQPIPFSHRIHATNKQISCFFCHPYAAVSSNAGIPPVDKCLLCHNVIASNFKPITRIREYGNRGEGIPWARVNQLPEFVHFSHECHIAVGHDCSECHGDVKAMDRIVPAQKMDMNFCVTCHKKNRVSVNCFICHY